MKGLGRTVLYGSRRDLKVTYSILSHSILTTLPQRTRANPRNNCSFLRQSTKSLSRDHTKLPLLPHLLLQKSKIHTLPLKEYPKRSLNALLLLRRSSNQTVRLYQQFSLSTLYLLPKSSRPSPLHLPRHKFLSLQHSSLPRLPKLPSWLPHHPHLLPPIPRMAFIPRRIVDKHMGIWKYLIR